eukprot:3331281-Rhodomonas_salina.1
MSPHHRQRILGRGRGKWHIRQWFSSAHRHWPSSKSTQVHCRARRPSHSAGQNASTVHKVASESSVHKVAWAWRTLKSKGGEEGGRREEESADRESFDV